MAAGQKCVRGLDGKAENLRRVEVKDGDEAASRRRQMENLGGMVGIVEVKGLFTTNSIFKRPG